MKTCVWLLTLCLVFNLTSSQVLRRCELQVYSEGLQCKCCNINSFLCHNHCCPMTHKCMIKNRQPRCEGPGYSDENDKDWVKAEDKEQADFDECKNEEAKRYQYLQSRRLTAFTLGHSGL